ncbi:MAG TPA: DUF952 domain-containing protein [Stellaceae bacterium]|jgi:uncharacterized protein (DUF952 family)|nr:DUF952 domain-containing protein [Stellaceae bacterium]
MPDMIYHMCPAATWAEAVAAGRYTGTEDDRRDGFIHFSTAAQIAESARRHRAGQRGLLLIAVAAEQLGDRLRWETSRGGDLFPHVYGALDPAETVSAEPLPLGADGEHIFPPLR